MLPPEIRDLKPERMLPLLEHLADRTLAGEFEPVVCLEAPELVDVPDSLRRDDGLPVYRRHMTTRYATAARLSLEEQLLADAGRRRAPLVERERAAQLLGSDSATLTAQLDRKPEAGSDQTTAAGLRLDQAAAIWSALTDRKTSTVLTGPAGSGKTHALAAAALAARRAGVRHVYGTAASQAARNVLAAKLAEMGVQATVLNSTQFLEKAGRPPGDPHGLHIWPGSLILVDEASMLPASHAAAIKRIAARTGSKEITAGDQEQLQAVEEGGAMGLQARQHGYLQLAEPVRFTRQWERDASLRLRAGDATVADVYDQHGRIHGGSPEEVIEGAAQMAVTLLAGNQDVILMARSRDLVRELSRRVRDELTRLGVIDPGPSVPLAAGARASVHDLVINRRNDHKAGLANGDVVRIEEITSDGEVLIRKATGRDPVTGEPVFARTAIARRSLREFDSAYARTAHTTQGSQGTVGIPVATGDEDRQWLYSAATRGWRENHIFVMTRSPHQSDPAAGPAAAPEIGRYDGLQRFRAGQGRAGRRRAGPRPPRGRRRVRRRHRPRRHRAVRDRVPAPPARQRRPPRPPGHHVARRHRWAAHRTLPADPRRRRATRLRRRGGQVPEGGLAVADPARRRARRPGRPRSHAVRGRQQAAGWRAGCGRGRRRPHPQAGPRRPSGPPPPGPLVRPRAAGRTGTPVNDVETCQQPAGEPSAT